MYIICKLINIECTICTTWDFLLSSHWYLPGESSDWRMTVYQIPFVTSMWVFPALLYSYLCFLLTWYADHFCVFLFLVAHAVNYSYIWKGTILSIYWTWQVGVHFFWSLLPPMVATMHAVQNISIYIWLFHWLFCETNDDKGWCSTSSYIYVSDWICNSYLTVIYMFINLSIWLSKMTF